MSFCAFIIFNSASVANICIFIRFHYLHTHKNRTVAENNIFRIIKSIEHKTQKSILSEMNSCGDIRVQRLDTSTRFVPYFCSISTTELFTIELLCFLHLTSIVSATIDVQLKWWTRHIIHAMPTDQYRLSPGARWI